MLKFNFEKTEKLLFGFLLFTIVWIALPLGSNRPWAWSFMQISCFVLGLFLAVIQPQQLVKTYEKHKLLLWLWVISICCQLINIIPLPINVIELIRPERLAFRTVNTAAISADNTLKWLSLSFDVGQSKVVLLKSIAYLFIFFSVLVIVNSTHRLKIVLAAICATGIFQAIYGSLEVLSGLETSLIFHKEVSNIATGTFVYKNHFANYLVLTLSAAIGYLVASLPTARSSTNRDKLRTLVRFWLSNKLLFRIGVILMVIALVMSRSRMGNTAFFVSLTITATLGLLHFKPRRKSYIAFFMSMLVIDILILSSLFGLEKVQQRIENTSFSQESRDEVVNNTLPLIRENVLFGSGGGTFYALFPQNQPESIQHFYDHAHNEYIQFILEFGVIGSLAIAILTLMCLACSINAMKTRRHPTTRGAAFAAVMAILGMLIHSTVDFPLQAPANTFIFIIFLAIGIQSKNIKVSPSPTRG